MNASQAASGDGGGGFVGALVNAAVHVAWERAGPASLRALPASPGVVCLEDAAGKTLLLGATADARGFATKRLAADGAEVARYRADLSEVAARVTATPVASGFEADLVYLAMARRRTPRVYRQLMARAALYVVRLDASDGIPEPAVLALEAAGDQRAECLLGPIEKKMTGRLVDGVVDAFDLCRYPSILRQAPRGVACAYKQMGRCPAPCDGTEAMESFRERVVESVRVMGRTPGEREASIAEAMREAGAASRYEEAAALKRSLERVRALDAGALKGVSTFGTFRHIVAAPGLKRDGVRLYGWSGGRLTGVWDDAEEVEGRVAGVMSEGAMVPRTEGELEAVLVLVKWGREAKSRRRVRVVRLTGEGDAEKVREAARSVVRVKDAEEAAEIEEVEHAGGG